MESLKPRKLPHLSPRKLSTSAAAWQTERRPTNHDRNASQDRLPSSPSRADAEAAHGRCHHHTSHQQPAAKVTPTHTHLCAQPHLGCYHSISTTAASSLLETLTRTASCSLSSVSATLPSITHPTTASPSCWTARCHRCRGWWHRVRLLRGGHGWRAPRQGTRILPSACLSAGPVVQDLACCAALVDASVASPYHVHPASQVASAARCLAACISPPENCTLHARPLPTLRTLLQDCACESEMVGTDGCHRSERT